MARLIRPALALLLGLTQPALAYDLLHPVPRAEMPELSTDRPDKTEAWATVPAGHWQLESDLAVVSRDQADGLRTEDWSSLAFNLKAGLADGLDLQFVHEPLLRGSAEDLATGDTAAYAGRGDTTLRLKLTLRRPDGATPGLALMPWFKLATADEGLGNGQPEGGLILPAGWELPAGWGLSAMLELDGNADSQGAGHHLDTVLSASASHAIVGPLEAYFELWGQISGEEGVDGETTFDAGLTYGLGENAQIDLGLNTGLNANADDIEPFLGLSLRL